MSNNNLSFKFKIIFVLSSLLISSASYAEWPAKAYTQKNLTDAITALYGQTTIENSNLIKLRAPEIAENGAVVPIRITSELKNIESVSIFVEDNPNPLVANFKMTKNQRGEVNTRIKIGDPSNVIAVVKADGKLYTNKQFVKVTIPGCGGGETKRQ